MLNIFKYICALHRYHKQRADTYVAQGPSVDLNYDVVIYVDNDL